MKKGKRLFLVMGILLFLTAIYMFNEGTTYSKIILLGDVKYPVYLFEIKIADNITTTENLKQYGYTFMWLSLLPLFSSLLFFWKYLKFDLLKKVIV